MSKASEKAAEAAEKAKGLFKGITSKVKNLKGGKEEKEKQPDPVKTNGAPPSAVSPGRSVANPGGADLSKWEAMSKPPSSTAPSTPGLPPPTFSAPDVPAEPEHNVLEDLPSLDEKKSPKLEHMNAARVGGAAQARKPPTRKPRGPKKDDVSDSMADAPAPAAAPVASPAPVKTRPAPPPSSSKPSMQQPALTPTSSSENLNPTASHYTTAPMSGQTEFIRVFLEDDSMKAVNITVPCSVADLTDALRKKMYMVDTTGFVIFEYRGSKQVRVLNTSDDVRAVMSAWGGDPMCKFVFKLGDATDGGIDEPAADPFPVHHIATNRPPIGRPVIPKQPEPMPEPEMPQPEIEPPALPEEPTHPVPAWAPPAEPDPPPSPQVFAEPTDLSQGSALGALLAARKPAAAKPPAITRPGKASAAVASTPISSSPPAAVASSKAASKPAPVTASLTTTATPSTATTSAAATTSGGGGSGVSARPVVAKPVAAKGASKVAAITAKTDLSKKPPRTWTPEEVVEWMNGASLSHSWVFFENRVTGQQLMDVNPGFLAELGIDEAVGQTIIKALEKLKEERLNMLKNIRSGGGAASATSATTTPPPAAATPTPAATPAPAASPKPAALKAALAPKAAATPKADATPAPAAGAKPTAALKAAAKPVAAAKPAAAAAAPAAASASPAKGKSKEGVTLDATGEGTVRVYIGDTWRAFYLTGATTADDVINTIQMRCSSLLAQSGLDTAAGGLFEVKNMIHETPLEGTASPLTVCRAWVGNSSRLVYKDKAAPASKATKEVMKVFNADGSAKALVVANSLTAAEFLQLLAESIKPENPAVYQLWEVDDATGESHSLAPEDNVWMMKSRWLGSDDFRFVYSPTKPPASPTDGKEAMTSVQKKLLAKTKNIIEQAKAFLGWANVILAKKSQSIDSLEALRDGVKLHALMEIITGKPLGKCSANPVTIRQRIENVTAVQSVWAAKGWTFGGYFPEDVVDGNVAAISHYLWPMVCNSFQPTCKFSSEQETRSELLQWVRMKASPVKVENFDSSWRDGQGFCTIIAKLRPANINIAEAQANKDRAVHMAVAAAEAAGVPKGMLWLESFVQPDWQPDDRSVFAYLAVYYRLFASN